MVNIVATPQRTDHELSRRDGVALKETMLVPANVFVPGKKVDIDKCLSLD